MYMEGGRIFERAYTGAFTVLWLLQNLSGLWSFISGCILFNLCGANMDALRVLFQHTKQTDAPMKLLVRKMLGHQRLVMKRVSAPNVGARASC